MNDAVLRRLRDIVQRDVGGRGLCTDPRRNLITECADDFANACRSLAGTKSPSVAIVTGFFIPTGQPPAGETDGPLGALFLARTLVSLGFRVVLATDTFCTGALEVGLKSCGLTSRVPVITLPNACGLAFAAYRDAFRRQTGPLTHLIALERVGPNHLHTSLPDNLRDEFAREIPEGSRDRCYSMRGRDITEAMSPAHWLFESRDPGVVTIGIGDGGNEIGMGKIPWDVVRRNIARGGLVACRVPTDHLIVAGTSNWGAYALAAGVLGSRGVKVDDALFDVEQERRLLQIMVECGPLVDGVAGTQTATVDGLSFETYAAVFDQLQRELE